MKRYKKTTCPVHFHLVHTTIPNYNRVTRIILAHILGGNFKSFCEVNQKFQRFLLFFSIPRHIIGNQAAGQNRARIGAYVMQTLYYERMVNTFVCLKYCIDYNSYVNYSISLRGVCWHYHLVLKQRVLKILCLSI